MPASQMPCHLAAMTAASGRGSGSGAKLGFSGQNPVSSTPTITPSPARAEPPNCCCHTPPPPLSPRKLGVVVVSAVNRSLFHTRVTPLVRSSRAASPAVSFMAKPLSATS